MLKIALPNGSLEKETAALWKRAGISFKTKSRRYTITANDGIISTPILTRPQHIPELVARGNYDAGICGEDSLQETGVDVAVLGRLHLGKAGSPRSWRVVLVADRQDPVTKPSELPDHSVVLSEYPAITRAFFKKISKRARIKFSYGSTEAHVPHDFRFGVCVTVSGVTLKANGLKILAFLTGKMTAALIANKKALKDSRKGPALRALAKRLKKT